MNNSQQPKLNIQHSGFSKVDFELLGKLKFFFAMVVACFLLLILIGCAHRNHAEETPLEPSDLGVVFLHTINNSTSNHVEGVFQITNKLNKYIYIYTTSIQAKSSSGWSFLSKTQWHSLGMIDSHEQFLFQTWVPERGGLYRLELYGSQAEYFSPPFRISPGPPMKPEDLPVINSFPSSGN